MTIEEIAILIYSSYAKHHFIKFHTDHLMWNELDNSNKAVWIAVANTLHRCIRS